MTTKQWTAAGVVVATISLGVAVYFGSQSTNISIAGNGNVTAIGANARATATTVIANDKGYYQATSTTSSQYDAQTLEYTVGLKLIGNNPPPLLCVIFYNVDGSVKPNRSGAIDFDLNKTVSVTFVHSATTSDGAIACIDRPPFGDWQVSIKISNQKNPLEVDFYPQALDEPEPEWVKRFQEK